MPTPLRLAAVLALVLVTTTGCVSSDDGSDASSPPSPPSPSPASPSATVGGSASPAPSTSGSVPLPDDLRTRPAVVAAIADTAKRRGVDPGEVGIAAWSPVTWNDGSLGCPTKGTSYTQSLVEGELLVLRVGSGRFQYHARTGGPFVYCVNPSAGSTVGG